MKNRKLLFEIFKFLIVGGLAFIIDYLILIFCRELIGFKILISSAIAFIISTIFNYILSIKWVFNIRGKNSSKTNFTIFVVFSIIGLSLTQLIMWYGCDKLRYSYLIIKIIATGIVMIFNYITRKIFLK